jgi:hypothetical protein
MGDDGFFSVIDDAYDYLTGKKKGGFGKYDRVVDRTLDQIPDRSAPRSQKMPAKAYKKRSYASKKPRTSNKKRKRTYTPTNKPKKILRKKYKKRTSVSTGLIDVSKRATAPKGHVAMLRRKTYGTVQSTSYSKMAWIGVSDVGQQQVFAQAVAQAILMKYLTKMGDHRTETDYNPSAHSTAAGISGAGAHSYDMFHSFQVKYSLDAYGEGTTAAQDFFGSSIINDSIDTMTTVLGAEIVTQAKLGRYPSLITFFRDDFISAGSVTKGAPRLLDNRLGDHYLDMKITTLLRLQNISPSDSPEAGADTVHDIHANPIQGKVFTFRNQRPHFKDAYQSNNSFDTTTRVGMQSLNDYDQSPFDVIKGATNDDAFAHISRPPLNPRSLFSNAAGHGSVMLAPGAYRGYNCKFQRSETVKNFIKGVFRIGDDGKMPPIGASMMMCFQPSMRTSDTELVKLGYDYTAVYNCGVRFKKQMGLPVRDIS